MFKIIKTPIESVTPVVLTVEQEKLITDLYVSTNGNVIKTKHKMGKIRVSSSVIKEEFQKRAKIFALTKKAMAGEVVISEEESHIDETTLEKVIDKEAVYNKIPITDIELKTELEKYYTESSKESLAHTADKIIKYSDGTDECTWDKFKVMFVKVVEEPVEVEIKK